MACKRKAPWTCCEDAFVKRNGEWGPKRTYCYVNGWNPSIATHFRCNHDCKILTNGSDSAKLTYYCTCYATKRLKRTHNSSAITASGYSFDQRDDAATRGVHNANRLMIYRCLTALTKQQEIPAPLVMSYLMGWGDMYQSHRFVPIYWTSFALHLLAYFPGMKTNTKL
jgi:hypothetical protein